VGLYEYESVVIEVWDIQGHSNLGSTISEILMLRSTSGSHLSFLLNHTYCILDAFTLARRVEAPIRDPGHGPAAVAPARL